MSLDHIDSQYLGRIAENLAEIAEGLRMLHDVALTALDKPPFTSVPGSGTPERGGGHRTTERPAVRWIESLEYKLQQIRLTVFSPEYLRDHQEFTDADQGLLLDAILDLQKWKAAALTSPTEPTR